jgi:hypothetical protein
MPGGAPVGVDEVFYPQWGQDMQEYNSLRAEIINNSTIIAVALERTH